MNSSKRYLFFIADSGKIFARDNNDIPVSGVEGSYKQLPNRWKDRLERFAPNGVPKHIRIYDNGGETWDRYTCCFKSLRIKTFPVLGMSDSPYFAQGFGQHSEYPQPIDCPRYSHLGKKVKWESLPHDVQCCIWQDYRDYWDLPVPTEYVYGYKKGEHTPFRRTK